VGQAMGQGDNNKAKMYFKLVALYNFIINGILALTILAFREGFARIYTN
jgi:Na+-driven multidrug efflux pump